MVGRVTAAFERRKRVPLPPRSANGLGQSGFTTVPDEREECDFVVEVDLDKLVRMIGDKARTSKRGRSALQGGAVVVRVVGRRRLA